MENNGVKTTLFILAIISILSLGVFCTHFNIGYSGGINIDTARPGITNPWTVITWIASAATFNFTGVNLGGPKYVPLYLSIYLWIMFFFIWWELVSVVIEIIKAAGEYVP
jgi:nickel-dependent lactate racemase